jgi:hypothetical protein
MVVSEGGGARSDMCRSRRWRKTSDDDDDVKLRPRAVVVMSVVDSDHDDNISHHGGVMTYGQFAWYEPLLMIVCVDGDVGDG